MYNGRGGKYQYEYDLQNKNMKIDRSAFTLTELLAVIAILAALAAVLLPLFFMAQRKGGTTTCVANKNIWLLQ